MVMSDPSATPAGSAAGGSQPHGIPFDSRFSRFGLLCYRYLLLSACGPTHEQALRNGHQLSGPTHGSRLLANHELGLSSMSMGHVAGALGGMAVGLITEYYTASTG